MLGDRDTVWEQRVGLGLKGGLVVLKIVVSVSVRMWRQGIGNLSSAQNKEGNNIWRCSDKVVAKQDNDII